MKLFILIGFIVFIVGCVAEEVVEPVIEEINAVEKVAESPLVNENLTDEEILEKYDDGLDDALEDLDLI